MTRKQAILQAIAILKKNDENQEICRVLTELLHELPICHWSKKTILDAFDQYILEHNKLPSKSEIKDNPKIPTHSTIKNRFGLTLQNFYKEYYGDYIKKCPSRVYHYQSVDFWINNFKEQYIKNDYPTQREYDLLRDKNTPSSRHLVKISGYKNWNELLDNCGFEIHGQNCNSTIILSKKEFSYNVNFVRNKNVNENQIKEINDSLQKIISDDE